MAIVVMVYAVGVMVMAYIALDALRHASVVCDILVVVPDTMLLPAIVVVVAVAPTPD